MVKNPPVNVGRRKRHKFSSCVGKIPCNRKWQPTLVFLSGKFHGQRSLAGYSPWGHTQLYALECTFRKES